MKNIPDFSIQVLEIERHIKARADVAAEDWKDSVQERYYDRYIRQYEEKMELYIHGGMNMSGMGIDKLMLFVSDKLEQMSQLTGMSEDVAFVYAAGPSYCGGGVHDNYDNEISVEEQDKVSYRNGVVHNERFEREYWNERHNGIRPGEYDNDDIVKIMEEREKNR